MSKVIITYGTFDLFHIGHLRLLERARSLGDSLIVGVSTDEFNMVKGKKTFIDFSHRMDIVRSLRCVDAVFPETSWEQKLSDVANYSADIFVMGNDWTGRFDFLKDRCQVVYLPRTEGVSSGRLRTELAIRNASLLQNLQKALESASAALLAVQQDRAICNFTTCEHLDKCHQSDASTSDLSSELPPQLGKVATQISLAARLLLNESIQLTKLN